VYSVLTRFLLFQVAWFACVLTRSWTGVAIAALCVGVHLCLSRSRLSEFAMIMSVTLTGTLLDSALMNAGIFVFHQHVGLLCPFWLTAIWAAFATTLGISSTLFSNRLVLAAAVGAVAGPLAYFAGSRLGAMDFGWPLQLSLGTLFVLWAALVPLLLIFYRTVVVTRTP